MARATATECEQKYVESLRWRRGDLQGKIAAVRGRLQALTAEESEFLQELRAVEQLLFAADGAVQQVEAARPNAELDTATRRGPGAESSSLDLSGYGPTARRIYVSVERVIRDAGVPLHYRVLAEEVQKHAPLSGKDPGATLIAHLHRAQELFPRVGRGVYGVQGMVNPDLVPEQPSNEGKATKRRRTRRRRTR